MLQCIAVCSMLQCMAGCCAVWVYHVSLCTVYLSRHMSQYSIESRLSMESESHSLTESECPLRHTTYVHRSSLSMESEWHSLTERVSAISATLWRESVRVSVHWEGVYCASTVTCVTSTVTHDQSCTHDEWCTHVMHTCWGNVSRLLPHVCIIRHCASIVTYSASQWTVRRDNRHTRVSIEEYPLRGSVLRVCCHTWRIIRHTCHTCETHRDDVALHVTCHTYETPHIWKWHAI